MSIIYILASAGVVALLSIWCALASCLADECDKGLVITYTVVELATVMVAMELLRYFNL